MAKCAKCGRKSLFLWVDQNGICNRCNEEIDRAMKSINAQIVSLKEERVTVQNLPKLAPEELNGKKISYHYPDVNIWITWQYSGQYGKSCESAGMKRGDKLELKPHKEKEDPDAIQVYWNGEFIGHMKSNRLREMVKQWKSQHLPIFCAVSAVGGEQKLLLELAFYGRAKR